MSTIRSSILALSSVVVITACGGGETQRSISNSNDLTGLWRMSLESSQIGLRATSNSSFILTESSSGLVMNDCSTRTTFDLEKKNGEILGLPISPLTIDDNDTLSGSSQFGDVDASKITANTSYDMGSLQLSSPNIGVNNFTDLCVLSSDASVLGITASNSVTAVTIFNGELLQMEVTVMGSLNAIEYDLAREPGSGEASILFRSEAFRGPFNRTEMTLASGTMTVSEDSVVWTKGTFSGAMTNGTAFSGEFSFEKP